MELVKKYHPDKYQGNPLADLAQEKLQEVKEAYDLLMKSSGAGNGASPYGAQPFSGGYAGGSAYGSGQAGYGSGNYGSYSSSSPVYNQIRSCINRGDIGAAERLLQSIPERSQEAEWLFLRGVISYSKGLIAEVGRKEALGRPILYGTTDAFLRHFCLGSLDELPEIDFTQLTAKLSAAQDVPEQA